MRTLTRRTIALVLDHPAAVVAGILALTTVLAGFLGGLQVDFTIEHLFARGDPAMERYFQFRDEFQREDNVILLIYECDDPLRRENLVRAATLIDSLAEIEGILEVTGLPNVELFTAGEEYLLSPVYDPVPGTPDSLQTARERILSSELLRDFLIAGDFELAAISLELDDGYNTHRHRQRILEEIDAVLKGVDWIWHQAGIPVLRTRYVQYMLSDNLRFMIPVSLILAALLGLLFRSWVGVLIPLGTVLMADIWTLGLMSLVGVDITIISYLIPTLLLIVGTGDGVHFLVKYHAALRDLGDRRRALEETLRKIGRALFLTSLTTAVGFGALTTARIRIVQEFGLITAAGVFIAFLLSVLFIPALLLLLKPTPPARLEAYSRGLRVRIIRVLIRFVRTRPRLIIASGFVVLSIGLVGALRLVPHSSLLADLRSGDRLYDDMHLTEERMGSILPLELVVEIDSSSGVVLQEPEVLAQVEALQSFLTTIPEVGKVVSIIDYLKAIHRAMHDGDQAYYKIPANRATVAQYLLLYEGQFEALVNFDYTKTRIAARIRDLDSRRSEEIVSQIQGFLAQRFPPYLRVEITGTTFLALRTNHYLAETLTNSFILAFAVITLVIILLFRSIKIALISIIPNMIPMVIMAAVMGYFGIPLRPATAMTFAIAFGIAVDDTLHYLIRYRQELMQAGGRYREANDATMQGTGIAMISTTVILVSGFLILTQSRFIPTFEFGLLSSITIFSALLGDLTFLPAMLSLVRPAISRERRPDGSPGPSAD